MRVKKFDLSKENNTLEPKDQLIRELAMPRTSKLHIRLLEIAGVESPSELTFKIRIQENTKLIPFFVFRSKCLYQNNIFILDTSEIDHFNVDISSYDFSISVESESEAFKVSMFCTTDQPQLTQYIEIVA